MTHSNKQSSFKVTWPQRVIWTSFSFCAKSDTRIGEFCHGSWSEVWCADSSISSRVDQEQCKTTSQDNASGTETVARIKQTNRLNIVRKLPFFYCITVHTSSKLFVLRELLNSCRWCQMLRIHISGHRLNSSTQSMIRKFEYEPVSKIRHGFRGLQPWFEYFS